MASEKIINKTDITRLQSEIISQDLIETKIAQDQKDIAEQNLNEFFKYIKLSIK